MISYMTEKNYSTHIIYDGEEIVISQDLWEIFDFLWNIDKELKSLMEIEQRLKSLKSKYLDIFENLVLFVEKAKEAKIDLNYELSKDTFDVKDEIQNIDLYRSQMITLFSYMETLFSLVTVYDQEISSKKEVIGKTKNNSESLINQFILNEENVFYKRNKERFSKITAGNLKDLRNMLTHFFSVSPSIGIIAQEAFQNILPQVIEIENLLHSRGHIDYVYISPNNFYELLQDAFKLVMIKRNNDTVNSSIDFKRKINLVLEIVMGHGAKVVNIK